nr:unnamed protein product [Spirometra erinaceieuropaei]
MFSRRGDAVCTSRRCELRHLAACAERVITRRQIDVSVDGVGVRRLQQLSPCLVAGSRQYPRVDEVELMPFLQQHSREFSSSVGQMKRASAPFLASGLLDSVFTPGPGGEWGIESVVDAAHVYHHYNLMFAQVTAPAAPIWVAHGGHPRN